MRIKDKHIELTLQTFVNYCFYKNSYPNKMKWQQGNVAFCFVMTKDKSLSIIGYFVLLPLFQFNPWIWTSIFTISTQYPDSCMYLSKGVHVDCYRKFMVTMLHR